MPDLIEEALALSVPERRDLMRKIERSLVKEQRASNIKERYEVVKSAVETAMDHKIQDGRLHEDVVCRMYIAYILKQDGYFYSEIGSVLGKNHSTICYLVQAVNDMLSLPLIYQDEVSKLNEIQSTLHVEDFSDNKNSIDGKSGNDK